MVIDCQWHWYPPAFCEALLYRTSYPRCARDGAGYLFEPSDRERWRYHRDFVDLDRQLATMDAAGIDLALMSPSIAGDVTGLEAGHARELALLLNEAFADAQRRHPERIRGLAVLPLQDPAASVELLEDAAGRLGLAGVLLHSNVGGGSLADPALRPVYARAAQLGMPLFLHPTRAFQEPRVSDFALEPPLAYMFDTTVAALSLIVAGVLDELPELKLVHPHFGGTLPYLVDRAEVYRSQGRWATARPLREYLPLMWTDTVSESPGALAIARELYGIERILFATDFPYFAAQRGVDFARAQLDGEDAERVLSRNAQALLAREAVVR